MKFLHAAVLASCLALPLATTGFEAQAATAHNIQNGTSSTNANRIMMHSRPMMMKRHHMMRKRHPMMRHKMMRHHMMRPMHKMM